MAFHFEEKILNQMSLIVIVLINLMLNIIFDSAGDNHDPASFFNPFHKLLAIVSLVGNNQFPSQIKVRQKVLSKANIIAVATGQDEFQGISQSIRNRVDLGG